MVQGLILVGAFFLLRSIWKSDLNDPTKWIVSAIVVTLALFVIAVAGKM
jgi:hypothetical protein